MLTKPADIYLGYVFNETLNTLERRAGGDGSIAATWQPPSSAMLKKPGVSPDQQATLVETVGHTGSAEGAGDDLPASC